MSELAWRAYAKINLCLSVGAPEPQGSPKAGWHLIASWMQCIDLFDGVRMRRLPDGAKATASVGWAPDAPRPSDIDWPIEKDLAFRALTALEGHFGRPLPVALEVAKRIPVGGGLGGGSSDAAAVLLGVPRLFDLTLATDDLRRLAASLGSDVGFFADEQAGPDHAARPAIVAGFGEEVRRVDAADSALVLVIPGYACPTGPVYAAFDEHLKELQRAESLERARRGLTGPERQLGPRIGMVESRWDRAMKAGQVDGDRLFNDLAIPAFRVEPRLGELVTTLSRATHQRARVTGSGSCIFMPERPSRAAKLLERVQRVLSEVSEEEYGRGATALLTRLV